MASKDLAQETKNTLDLIKTGLKNPAPWLVSNVVAADNTKVANYVAAFNNSPVNIPPVQPGNTIKNTYIPARDKVLGRDTSKGAKILITAQAQFEGYKPGTLAFKTNNPGNIHNTDKGDKHYFDSLEDGIKAQYNHIVKIIKGIEPNYILNTKKTAPGVVEKATGIAYPGINFIYTGKLEQYLKIYATGPRKDDNYLNFIIGFFKNNGITITRDTTLQEIYDIK
jgi:hypothetical protein